MELTLEKSYDHVELVEEFNKAMQLVKSCNDKLNSAEEAISKIVQENGEVIEFNTND